jgi:hypothetical protein
LRLRDLFDAYHWSATTLEAEQEQESDYETPRIARGHGFDRIASEYRVSAAAFLFRVWISFSGADSRGCLSGAGCSGPGLRGARTRCLYGSGADCLHRPGAGLHV